MGFLAPWFLVGALALGLPVWLHLLKRSQKTPQLFPSLMFFERRVQSSSKQRKLRYLALLAARLTLLLCVVLGFAVPYILRQTSSLHKRGLTVIAIDRSFSMRAGERFNQAKQQARDLAESLPGTQPTQVIAFDRNVENLSGTDTSRSSAVAAISSLQPSDLESSYGELVRTLHVLAQSRGASLNVHLFSDLQATSMPQDFRDLSLGNEVSLTVHPIAGAAPNWTIENVVTPARVFDPKTTHLSATIAGWNTPAETQQVQLVLDGRVLDAKSVAVAANGRATVEFRGFAIPYGAHRGEVRISHSDALPADNRYFFSTERSDPKPVLFLYARGRMQQAFYYKTALESAADTGLTVDVSPVERIHGRDLTPYAFVVLHDLGSLDKGVEDQICRYLMGGGAALVAMGPEVWQSGRVPLSKVSLSTNKETEGAGFVDASSQALQGVGHFDNVQFFETARWEPGKDNRILARFADNAPLLVEQNVGEGRMLRFASTLDSAANDFPLHASYLPFVVQTARFLSGAVDATASYVVGSAISLRRGREGQAASDVLGPDGQHLLTLAQAKADANFTADREGFYEVTRAGGRRELVATHPDRRESDLRPVTAETLNLWVNTGGKAGARTEAQGTNRDEQQERQPWSFWRYLLIAAVAAAVAESVLARRHVEEAQRLI